MCVYIHRQKEKDTHTHNMRKHLLLFLLKVTCNYRTWPNTWERRKGHNTSEAHSWLASLERAVCKHMADECWSPTLRCCRACTSQVGKRGHTFLSPARQCHPCTLD